VPPERDAAVIATLNVEAANGTRITTQTWLDVEYLSVQKKRFERLADKEFSTFRFIGFDLGNAAATARHKRIINEYVLPLVGKQATIAITGHTDAVGDDAANVRLSRARAESISQAIGIGNRTVKGVGGSVLLYPNDTPEGRMYSRTVEIQVINPVQR
jgi:outer membrane protein OmpA-like peptidoglycan-associated protein